MIQFNHVCKTYPNGSTALKNISFHLPKGALALLSGHSGAGKTTLLKLILKLLTPSSGTILINKHNLNQLEESELPLMRQKIGAVLQTPQLLLEESVYDNISLPLTLAGYHSKEIRTRTLASLQKVGLSQKSKTKANSLSSGEQKLTEIARAIVTTPQILLIDEPTTHVDKQTLEKILTLFQAFHNVGITTLITSHEPTLLNGRESVSLHLKDGCLQQGVKQHVFQTENA